MLRPFLLATPRSGSTLVYEAMLAYLRQTRGLEGQGEFFFAPRPVRDSGRGIETGPFGPCCLLERPGDRERIAEERLGLLERYPGTVFFKVFPNQATPEVLSRLCESHQPVYLERRDLWEQFLSLAVSVATGVWQKGDGPPPEAGSLELDPTVRARAETLGAIIQMYREAKRALPPGPVLVYEELAETQDWKRILARIDLKDAIDWSQVKLPARQNQGAEWKLSRFRDPDALIASYRGTVLNELQPLRL